MSTAMQQSVAQPASLAGTSLHTGEKVTLTLLPAPADYGIKFRRKDLPDEPTIDASIDNVRMVERATTLGEGNIKVHTVEHILSALAAFGVDNAIVEMDANEPPIGDGSAIPYVELIENAGIKPLDVPRKVFEIREPLAIETGGGSILAILPHSGFKVSCTQSGPKGTFTQYLSLEITPEAYKEEIARARTFVHYEDIEVLMEKGLIKGGSLDNAIVIQGDAVVSKEPMRFTDEFVRHKILDIVGDLALFGQRIRGHVVAIKPGHGPNADLVRALKKLRAETRSMVPPLMIPHGEAVLDVNEVMKILPHRYPFLMVDRIIGFEGDNKCTGIKSVTMNEPYFPGHFPGHPVMPGVLQVEAMAQVGSVLLLRNPENRGKIGYFMSADGVKFRKPVVPGDTLFITCELIKARRTLGKAACQCVVNGVVVSEGELTFALIDG
jgi:UDP-3-O-[3-hydroxymyristoyl] N-acetylglucosamine deacetylase/3-hydroxyacyl-[acyl-carrier-protein] dehydratase